MLCSVAAFLLAVMGMGQEEEVFWTLVALTRHRLHPAFFEVRAEGKVADTSGLLSAERPACCGGVALLDFLGGPCLGTV